MRVLIVGAGVIGTVYGAQLSAAGHEVSVLAHGARTDDVARSGLRARDVTQDVAVDAPASVVDTASGEPFELVLVTVRQDQIQRAGHDLAQLTGQPVVLLFGNNPTGGRDLPAIPGRTYCGFPGVGGVLNDEIATYVRVPQQPTALPAIDDPSLNALARCLEARGFPVQRVADMDGWLVYHAAFVACVAAALMLSGNDPRLLSADRKLLHLMCRAITDGFDGLRALRIGGLPRNLAVLHRRVMLPVAVWYWAMTMRSPMGELCFAAHTRHAPAEMRALAEATLRRIPNPTRAPALHMLLGRASQPRSAAGS